MRSQLTATRWEDIPAVSRARAAYAGLADDLGTPALFTFGDTPNPERSSRPVTCEGVKHTQGMTVPARRLTEFSP